MSIKLIFASDSFKGSLSQSTISRILTEAANQVFEAAECLPLCISDGGEGALDAIIEASGGEYFKSRVSDPLFCTIDARYGAFKDTAVISMSECSGLTLIPESARNPLYTTTYGTGELIRHAADRGYKRIVVTVGGSATNDGGIGALTALGAKFMLKDGTYARGMGCELENIASADLSPLKRYEGIEFTVLTDVQNPLTGESGATKVFAVQKGADPDMIERLELGMQNYQKVFFDALNESPHDIPGGGAAGGLGFGLTLGLNANIKSGIDYILDLNEYDKKLDGATCVITGEGRIDSQTAYGKVISGVIERARKKGVPVFAIVGSVGEGAEVLYSRGLCGIYSIINKPCDLDGILANSEELYKATARSLFNTIKSLMK